MDVKHFLCYVILALYIMLFDITNICKAWAKLSPFTILWVISALEYFLPHCSWICSYSRIGSSLFLVSTYKDIISILFINFQQLIPGSESHFLVLMQPLMTFVYYSSGTISPTFFNNISDYVKWYSRQRVALSYPCRGCERFRGYIIDLYLLHEFSIVSLTNLL